MRTKIFFTLFVLAGFAFWCPDANAQCAMCRAALESHGDVAQAEAVNDGIVYLMVIPYVLVGVVGYWVYRVLKK